MKFATKLINEKMNLNLYLLSAFLLAIWFVGYMVFDLGSTIHFVFLLATTIFVYKLVKDYQDMHK